MEKRKSFLLRIDPALWIELEAWAQGEFRSVNGQIEYLLSQAVSARRRSRNAVPPASPEAGPAAAPPASTSTEAG